MPSASLTITDDDDGQVTVSADFGSSVDQTSAAHQMIMVLINSVVAQVKISTVIEDTTGVPDTDKPRIITGE